MIQVIRNDVEAGELIMPDGQRFVMVNANAQGTDEGFSVILVTNWFDELRERIGN